MTLLYAASKTVPGISNNKRRSSKHVHNGEQENLQSLLEDSFLSLASNGTLCLIRQGFLPGFQSG